MPTRTGDAAVLKSYIAAIRLRHILIAVGVLAFGILLQQFSGKRDTGQFGPDYRKVAQEFLDSNVYIAHITGKITSVRHIGVGGSGGDVSYNTFSITGADGRGYCQLTLKRTEDDLWYVDSATLMVSGREYNIPVKRTQPGKQWKLF